MLEETAFVFPGQGSQTEGMLSCLYEAYPIIKETFQEASNALGYDLWDIIANNPRDKLHKTEITQPALLVSGVSVWRAWQQKGPRPSVLAGHSLGEYTALVCADAISLADAAPLVAKRGQFMQEAVQEGQGAMGVLLGLTGGQVQEACQEAQQDQIVQIANYNSPMQIVVSGDISAVERVMQIGKKMGARRAFRLNVSVPSHSALMQPATLKLRKEFSKVKWQAPKIPVLHNFDVKFHSDVSDIKDVLIRQLCSPVRWIETVEHISSLGITHIVECGPGRILSGLNKRIEKKLSLSAIGDLESFNNLIVHQVEAVQDLEASK